MAQLWRWDCVGAAVAIRDGMATFESAAISAAVLDPVDVTRPA